MKTNVRISLSGPQTTPPPYAGVLTLLTSLVACGSEGGTREVDREKQLAQISFQDALELCATFHELTVGDEEYVEGACSSHGLRASSQDGSVSCTEVREECRAELSMAQSCWLASPDSEADSCPEARVGELVDCMTALATDTKQRYENVSCADPSSNVPAEEIASSWQNVRENPPGGCRALLVSCPEFFEGPAMM